MGQRPFGLEKWKSRWRLTIFQPLDSLAYRPATLPAFGGSRCSILKVISLFFLNYLEWVSFNTTQWSLREYFITFLLRKRD